MNILYISFLFLLLPILISSLILRGTKVSKDRSPKWMVSYHTIDKKEFQCAGTIISPRVIHTAAHCLKSASKENYIKLTLNDYEADVREVDDIKRNGYDWYLRSRSHGDRYKQDDYGLIFLDRPVSVCEDRVDTLMAPLIVDSLVFPTETTTIIPNEKNCTVTGWGLNEFDKYEHPLHFARTSKFYTTKGMIIVMKYKNNAKACNGDSGSPLICNANNIPILIGNIAGGVSDDPEAVEDASTDSEKCDLRNDIYSLIYRQMPVLEKQLRKRKLWKEFVETQKRCARFYQSENGGKWIH